MKSARSLLPSLLGPPKLRDVLPKLPTLPQPVDGGFKALYGKGQGRFGAARRGRT